MKRKDMDLTVLYAIERSHHGPRPGYVLNRGQHPGKVRARIYWTWPKDEDDWLNPTPQVLAGKYDDVDVTTANVLMPWADYCAREKARRQAKHQERLDAEAAYAAEKQSWVDRLVDLAPLISGYEGFCDLGDMTYMVKGDRVSDQRYSARHVIELLEHVARRCDTTESPVS
jgi:hypothetical protein